MREATIQKILKVEKHPNADALEIVTIQGWTCCSKIGEFKEGDLCVYMEIDSLLPIRDEFEFLRKGCYKKFPDGTEGFRVKTIRLRGQLSQGLCLPLSILGGDEVLLEEGTDVTQFLGVKHYEKPVGGALGGDALGHFPNFLSKTDEVRVQSAGNLLEDLQEKPYYITTKLDGTSATFYKKDDHFGVCSRNLELKEAEENAYWRMAKKYNLEELIPEGYCVQGEIVGPGIQKNPMTLKEIDFYVFNVYQIEGHKHLDFVKMMEFCDSRDINRVPVEETGPGFNYTQEDLLEKACGWYEGTINNKEGIVIRAVDKSISFKVINNDYLLKDED